MLPKDTMEKKGKKSSSKSNSSHECKICQKIFTAKESLKRHTVQIHEGNKKYVGAYECKICKKNICFTGKLEGTYRSNS